jgi:hypothetical protein
VTSGELGSMARLGAQISDGAGVTSEGMVSVDLGTELECAAVDVN